MSEEKKSYVRKEITLEVDGVYFTNVKDLVKIKTIDDVKDELYLYNITESCTQRVKLSTHRLVERVR